MSSRNYPKHVVATSQPPGLKPGDEWFEPITNVLYKILAANAATVQAVVVTTAFTPASSSSSSGGGGGSISIGNETSSSSSYYPMMSTASSGTLSTATVSSTKMYFVPSTGTLNATVFNSLSDETQKANKERIVDALLKLNQLGGYTYMLIDSNEPSAGLLAQEVQKVLPEAVRFNPDTGLLSLNYNAVLGMVVESINELDARVRGLENNG